MEMLDFRRAAMSQVEWGPGVETANGTIQNVNEGKLENNILAQEIDLSYAILPRSMNLDNGKPFTKTFGDKVGFRYYEDERRGIFWSNNPHVTIHQMAESLHQLAEQVQMQHDREIYRGAGVPDYRARWPRVPGGAAGPADSA